MNTRNGVAHTIAAVGVGYVLLGLVHTVAGLPLILTAVKNGAFNLPSIEDAGVGLQLLREPVVYAVLSVGVDRCVLGVILLLIAPELKKGRRLAWRIAMAIGLLLLFGYTPLIWIAFERVHLPALAMPVPGVLILVLLLLTRQSFNGE